MFVSAKFYYAFKLLGNFVFEFVPFRKDNNVTPLSLFKSKGLVIS